MPDVVLTADEPEMAPKEAAFASTMKNAKIRALLQNPQTPATVLMVMLIDWWGMDWFEWEPDTLREELYDEFNTRMPQVTLDKLWALVTYLTTDQFYTQLPIFIVICNVLSDTEADFETFDPATTEEMLWAVNELNLLEPITPKKFSQDIKIYAGMQMREDSVLKKPTLLQWAEDPPDTVERLDRFQDDPVFFNAIWDKQKSDDTDMMRRTAMRLIGMVSMLKNLPLVSGTTEKLKIA